MKQLVFIIFFALVPFTNVASDATSGSIHKAQQLIKLNYDSHKFITKNILNQTSKIANLFDAENLSVQIYVDKHIGKHRRPSYTGSLDLNSAVLRLDPQQSQLLYKLIEDQENILQTIR